MPKFNVNNQNICIFLWYNNLDLIFYDFTMQSPTPSEFNISGRLFNCSLNCALPAIMLQLQDIAFDENLQYLGAYEELKACFEQWYQIEAPLTFANFYGLLSSWTHSERELILAPVLRQFLVLKCQDPEQKIRLNRLIRYNNELIDPAIIKAFEEERLDVALSSEGRYIALDYKEANEYFYQHFGLYFQVTQDGQVKNPKPKDVELKVVDAYLKPGHFELSEKPPTKELVQLFPQSYLLKAYESMIWDDSFANTAHVLATLIPYVSQHLAQTLRQKPQ